MDIQKFVKQDNIKLLWEILLDETFQNLTKEELMNANQFLNNEIKLFYNTQINNKNANIDLLSLNKLFLEKIVSTYQHMVQPPKIQLKPQSAYTSENIQAERMSQFENQLSHKKQEFESAITLKKPPVPNFSDESRSEHIPINEMEALIAQTLAQRNFDISQINNNSKIADATNWLKPAETSIKAEKQQDNNESIKYIKIGREQLPPLTNDIVDINEQFKQEKKISWVDETNTNNIFSKLKLKSKSETPQSQSNSHAHQEIHTETQIEILTQRIEKLENIINKLFETKQFSNSDNDYAV